VSILEFTASPRKHILPVALIALGTVAAIYGVYSAPERTWPNLLLNGFNLTSLALSAAFFLAVQRVTGARWSASLRRIPEAYMLALPVAAFLMLLLFFGRHTIFPWSRPGFFTQETAIGGKLQYLHPPFAFIRMAATLFLWIFFAWLFRKTSLEQDRKPQMSLELHQRLNRYAIAFVLVFAFTLTFGAFDWLISLDPNWFSTIFAIYVFAGTFVQGIAAVTLAAVLLKERGHLQEHVSEHQLRDLGTMLFAFTIFWAYIWVCQYLLIWYGNLPDEITHYIKRTNGPWLVLFFINLIANWIIPFFVLLPVRSKCSTRVLKWISILLLCGHWLDLYLLIMPEMWRAPKFGFIEITVVTAYIALLYLLFMRNLAKAPLIPVNDPILAAEKLYPAHP
jgi:hypothetical protein